MELNVDSILFQIDLLCGLIFTFTAIITLLFPPKKINAIYGYRTHRSMKNDEAWKFAQQYSSIRLLYAGLLLCAFSCIGLFVTLNELYEVIIGTIALLIAVLLPIYLTEKALKSKQHETNHPH